MTDEDEDGIEEFPSVFTFEALHQIRPLPDAFVIELRREVTQLARETLDLAWNCDQHRNRPLEVTTLDLAETAKELAKKANEIWTKLAEQVKP